MIFVGNRRANPNIPPVQDESKSVYGNNPDIDAMDRETRKKAHDAMRQRRKKERERAELVKYVNFVLLLQR